MLKSIALSIAITFSSLPVMAQSAADQIQGFLNKYYWQIGESVGEQFCVARAKGAKSISDVSRHFIATLDTGTIKMIDDMGKEKYDLYESAAFYKGMTGRMRYYNGCYEWYQNLF